MTLTSPFENQIYIPSFHPSSHTHCERLAPVEQRLACSAPFLPLSPVLSCRLSHCSRSLLCQRFVRGLAMFGTRFASRLWFHRGLGPQQCRLVRCWSRCWDRGGAGPGGSGVSRATTAAAAGERSHHRTCTYWERPAAAPYRTLVLSGERLRCRGGRWGGHWDWLSGVGSGGGGRCDPLLFRPAGTPLQSVPLGRQVQNQIRCMFR